MIAFIWMLVQGHITPSNGFKMAPAILADSRKSRRSHSRAAGRQWGILGDAHNQMQDFDGFLDFRMHDTELNVSQVIIYYFENVKKVIISLFILICYSFAFLNLVLFT